MILEFSEVEFLESPRAKIVPMQRKHLSGLLEIAQESYIWKYFFEKGDEVEGLTEYVKTALGNKKAGLELPLVVIDKRSNKIAGTTRFYEYNKQLKTIKLGHTWYGKAFRGTGLNKHCKFLLFQFAFENLFVERIGFGVYESNKRSLAALRSVGCQTEGRLRNMFPALEGKGREDAILLSILQADWINKVKSELGSKLSAME